VQRYTLIVNIDLIILINEILNPKTLNPKQIQNLKLKIQNCPTPGLNDKV